MGWAQAIFRMCRSGFSPQILGGPEIILSNRGKIEASSFLESHPSTFAAYGSSLLRSSAKGFYLEDWELNIQAMLLPLLSSSREIH